MQTLRPCNLDTGNLPAGMTLHLKHLYNQEAGYHQDDLVALAIGVEHYRGFWRSKWEGSGTGMDATMP